MLGLLIASVVCGVPDVTDELDLATPRSRALSNNSGYAEYVEYVEIPIGHALSDLIAIVRHCRSVGNWVDTTGVGLASGFANNRVAVVSAMFRLRRVDPTYFSSGWVWYLADITASTTTFEVAVFAPNPASGDWAREQCLESLRRDSSPERPPLRRGQTRDRRERQDCFHRGADDDLFVSRCLHLTRDGRRWVDTCRSQSGDESPHTVAGIVRRWRTASRALRRDTLMKVVTEVDPGYFMFSEGAVCDRLASVCAFPWSDFQGVTCETTTVRRQVGSADVLNVLHVFVVTLTWSLSPTVGPVKLAGTEEDLKALVECLQTFFHHRLSPSCVTVSVPTTQSSQDAGHRRSERTERLFRLAGSTASKRVVVQSHSSRPDRAATQMRMWLASICVWSLALACAVWGWGWAKDPNQINITTTRHCEPTPGRRFVRVGSRLRLQWTRRRSPNPAKGTNGAPVGDASAPRGCGGIRASEPSR